MDCFEIVSAFKWQISFFVGCHQCSFILFAWLGAYIIIKSGKSTGCPNLGHATLEDKVGKKISFFLTISAETIV